MILLQQHLQQLGKLGRLDGRRGQEAVHLLQGADEDLMQLGRLLGRLELACIILGLGLLLQLAAQPDLFQERVKRLNHRPGGCRRLQRAAQAQQRSQGLGAQLVQLGKLGPSIVVPRGIVACRVGRPIRRPAAAGDVPNEGVILKQVDIRPRDTCQAGFEPAQDVLPLQAAGGGIQRGEDHLKHRLLQQGPLSGKIRRDTILPQDGLQNRAPGGVIRRGDGNLPIAEALAQQLQNRRRHGLGLGKRAVEPPQMHARRLPGPGRAARGKQMPGGKEDLVIPRWGHLPDEHPLPGLGRRPQQRPGCLAGRIKDRQAALKTVAAQAEGHRRVGPQQLLQDLQLHAGKIRKTVEIKRLVPGKIRLAQALGKIGQAVTRVLLPGGADSIVALKDQAQLLQLSGKQALGLTGGTAQVRRRHAVALPLVHRCQQLRQERGPAAAGGIALEPGADLLQRLGHGQDAPALVQRLPGHTAGRGTETRLASRVKLSTWAWRQMLLPPLWHSCCSAAKDACSGTIQIRWPSPGWQSAARSAARFACQSSPHMICSIAAPSFAFDFF